MHFSVASLLPEKKKEKYKPLILIKSIGQLEKERRERKKKIFIQLPTVYEFIRELGKLPLDTFVENFDNDDELNLVYINGFLSHSRRLKMIDYSTYFDYKKDADGGGFYQSRGGLKRRETEDLSW